MFELVLFINYFVVGFLAMDFGSEVFGEIFIKYFSVFLAFRKIHFDIKSFKVFAKRNVSCDF